MEMNRIEKKQKDLKVYLLTFGAADLVVKKKKKCRKHHRSVMDVLYTLLRSQRLSIAEHFFA